MGALQQVPSQHELLSMADKPHGTLSGIGASRISGPSVLEKPPMQHQSTLFLACPGTKLAFGTSATSRKRRWFRNSGQA